MILAINTASSWTTILTDRGQESWLSANDQAEKLMPLIEKLLQGGYQDLQAIYCVSGPGSFTGLRVGVTVANTIAFLTQCPLYPISTFDFWEHNRETLQAGADSAIIVNAGRKAVYLKYPQQEPQLINMDELQSIKEVYGDISEEQKQQLPPDTNFLDHQNRWSELLRTAIEKHKGQPVPIVEPLYIKPPNISKAKSKI